MERGHDVGAKRGAEAFGVRQKLEVMIDYCEMSEWEHIPAIYAPQSRMCRTFHQGNKAEASRGTLLLPSMVPPSWYKRLFEAYIAGICSQAVEFRNYLTPFLKLYTYKIDYNYTVKLGFVVISRNNQII